MSGNFCILCVNNKQITISIEPISSRVNASESMDSILGRVKPKIIEIGFAVSLLDVQQLKRQCEASTVCGRQVGRCQLDSKTERFLRCFLAKATR